MKKVACILLNWKRPDNLKIIIEDIRNQSADIDIYLWNNNKDDKTEYDVDHRIDSSDNLKCYPRWFLLNYVDADYAFVIDDDLTFSDHHVINDCLTKIPSDDTIIGLMGISLNSELMYYGSKHKVVNQDQDSPVDIIKGRFMFFNVKYLKSLDLPLFAKFDRIEDDIIVSSKAKYKILPSFLFGRFKELPEGDVALWKQPEHKRYRVFTTFECFKDEANNRINPDA